MKNSTTVKYLLNLMKKFCHNEIYLHWICEHNWQLWCCFWYQWLVEFPINGVSDWHRDYLTPGICNIINTATLEKMPFPVKMYTVMLWYYIWYIRPGFGTELFSYISGNHQRVQNLSNPSRCKFHYHRGLSFVVRVTCVIAADLYEAEYDEWGDHRPLVT